MEFDISRVYSAANADKLKVGSKVIVADTYGILKHYVLDDDIPEKLIQVLDENNQYRFKVDDGHDSEYALAYLVSEPEEKKLKWTDLKIGDIITDGKLECMVVSIDKSKSSSLFRICVVTVDGDDWLSNEELEEWKKVEEVI